MPPKATPKAPLRARRSKEEVDKEYAVIRQEVAAEQATVDPKADAAARAHQAEVREAAAVVTVENVVQNIAALGLDLSAALGNVGARLGEQTRLLATLQGAVQIERQELERLHKVDIAAAALDQMVAGYARESERLAADMSARRAEWAEETAAHDRERKEQDEALRKQRQREMDDYEYRKTLERKRAQDKYDEELRLVEKKNQDRQETLEKSWKLREAALKEQEEELARLRQESQAFPERLRQAEQAAVAQTRRETEAHFEQQALLLRKDAESDRRLAELRAKSLEESQARLTAQIVALEVQLAEAKAQVQEIAVRAIDGASGARALSHINQIAIEQAKNRPQS